MLLLQSAQEKRLSQTAGIAEAVGLVRRPGSGHISTVESGDWTARQDGTRRVERYVALKSWRLTC